MENTQLPKTKLRTKFDTDIERWVIMANATGNEVRFSDAPAAISFTSEGLAESYIDKLMLRNHYAYERVDK